MHQGIAHASYRTRSDGVPPWLYRVRGERILRRAMRPSKDVELDTPEIQPPILSSVAPSSWRMSGRNIASPGTDFQAGLFDEGESASMERYMETSRVRILSKAVHCFLCVCLVRPSFRENRLELPSGGGGGRPPSCCLP